METRPIGAFILSVLGGLFTLLGTVMGVILAPTCSYPYCYTPSYYYPFLATSTVCGIAVLIGAVLLYHRPEQHIVWGILILVLSGTASVGVITGYYALFGLAGVIMGVIGGATGIAWRSVEAGGPGLAGAVRMCPGCGRFVPLAYAFCPLCGTAAPSVRGPPGPAGPPPQK